MRQLPEGLAAHLSGAATTLCRCWSLTRRDGLVLGFTDHDRDLVFDDIRFSAAAGLEAAETTAELGFAIGGGEVAGAFAASGLSERDLSHGLYDDAKVMIWLVNWADPAQRVLLESGHVGEVRRSDHAFTAELRSLAKAFDEERGGLYAATCSADLGDARCGVHLAAATATVATTDGRLGLTALGLSDLTDGLCTGGKLVFTSGANLGFASEVKSHRKADGVVSLQLWQAPPRAIAIGDCSAKNQMAPSERSNGNKIDF